MKLSKTVTVTYEVCPINGSYYCVNEDNIIVKLTEDELEEFDIVDGDSENLIHNKLYFELIDDSQIISDGLVPVFISDNILQVAKPTQDGEGVEESVLLVVTEKESVLIYLGESSTFEKFIDSVRKLKGDRKILHTNYLSAE